MKSYLLILILILFNSLSAIENDFNGDGKADILWQKGKYYSLWYMSANGKHKYKYIGKKSPPYKVAGTGDFNGDGKTDILWKKDSKYSLWYMNANGSHKYKYIGKKSSSYQMVGVGDFNGDGKADILWQKGKYYSLWYMNANGKHKYKYIGQKLSTYKIVSVADFNGDGKTDILWKKGNSYSLWYMSANGKHKYKYIGKKPSTYEVASVADFNGDGKADILWKKGKYYSFWYMNASGSHKYKYIGKKSSPYEVAGVGDFNGNGKVDILWKKEKYYSLWYMNASGSHKYKYIGKKPLDYGVFYNGNPKIDRTEYYEIIAERKLVIDIKDIPSKTQYGRFIKDFKHTRFSNGYSVNLEKKQIPYEPNYGYIGEDEVQIGFFNKQGQKIGTRTYHINIKKAPLKGNRDFSIESNCQYDKTYLGYSRKQTFDIDIVNNSLERIENIYDNKLEGLRSSYSFRNPDYSRIELDYHGLKDKDYIGVESSIKYHNAFKKNFDKVALITCNYTKGYLRSIIPIKDKQWNANKPRCCASTTANKFIVNDLLFYISLLSELHTEIYLKEYSNSFNRVEALKKANSFMDKVFPNSHYKAEYQDSYYKLGILDRNFPNYLASFYEKENTIYYKKLKLLADTITDGDILKILNLIAENYESYYISGNNECKNSIICGTLFPEYTKSLTSNSEFKNSLEHWNQIENIDSSVGSGKIDFFPTQNRVSIELAVNRPRDSNTSSLDIDIHQIETLSNNKTIDDYFFNFDLDYVHGDTNTPFGGYESSGLAGVYTCFRDSNNKQLGCLSWSDHINKAYIFQYLGAHIMENSNKFYNIELYPIVRRGKTHLKEGFVETIALGATLKKYLPTIYAKDIKYIEYGIFASEFRSQSGACKECIAKVIANKINLLRVK